MTDFNGIDAGQDDVQGYGDNPISLGLGIGALLGFALVRGSVLDQRQAAWLGQQALTTAQAGTAMSNAVRPQ